MAGSRFLPSSFSSPSFLSLVKSLADFFFVAFVVEFQESLQDLTPGGFADCVPGALFGVVETVVEVEIGPAVGGGHGVVHLDVEFPELLDVGGGFVGIVEAVVGFGKPFLAVEHDLTAMPMRFFADGFKIRLHNKRKCAEAVLPQLDIERD